MSADERALKTTSTRAGSRSARESAGARAAPGWSWTIGRTLGGSCLAGEDAFYRLGSGSGSACAAFYR